MMAGDILILLLPENIVGEVKEKINEAYIGRLILV